MAWQFRLVHSYFNAATLPFYINKSPSLSASIFTSSKSISGISDGAMGRLVSDKT